MPFLTTSTINPFLPGFSRPTGWIRVARDVLMADAGGKALDIFLHGTEFARKNAIVKTFTQHMHSHPPMHTPKTNKEQNPQLTKHDAFVYLCSSCPTWWRAAARVFQDAPQDCSTSKAFSPRTVLTENTCTCVQRILQHFTTTMPFLTTFTTTFSCLASAAPQADSWWLGHVEPNDVIIADIGGQALDIFLHGPESAHKNGIVNTFTHTSIHINACTLLKKQNEKQTRKQKKSKMLHSPNMMLSFAGPLPVQCGGGRRPGRLAPAPQDSSTVEAFLPRTVLTQNLCSCVQQRDSDTCCRMMSFSRIFHVTPWTSFSTLQDLRTRMAL